MTIDGAHANGKWCGMCGEMGGDPMAAPLLLGLGLDEFSMSASRILPTRKIISNLSHKEMEELAREYGERDYLLHARLKNRIDSCNMSINRIKIKELEPKAKQLEETNPKEAIKIYEELNILKPGLKKYNKRIKACKNNFKKITKKLESEAKDLEGTNPKEAIKIYHKLNEINPLFKKYNKRIEILERKQK